MKQIEQLFRPGLLDLKPYASARDEFAGEALVFLDANENPYGSVLGGGHSRYPDPHQRSLKMRLSEAKGVPAENIFIGNGSDEAIDLLIRTFCVAGRDSLLIAPPTYGMYAVSAAINGVAVKCAPLTSGFALDMDALWRAIDGSTKMVFLCSPNNPTGNCLDRSAVNELLERFEGMVVIDEAYIDFASGESWLANLDKHRNLVVLQTFSKAWGLAGLRVGMAFADRVVTGVLDRIKPPYNVNSASQEAALRALSKGERKNEAIASITAERARLGEELSLLPEVRKVFPSDANFLLVRVGDAARIYRGLLERGIVVRDRSTLVNCENCLRISVGLPDENSELISALKELCGMVPAAAKPLKEGRIARSVRSTRETSIAVRIDLDGRGLAQIRSGLGFLNHMLEQIARHSGFDLRVEVSGDLHVDEHHTIEDTGLVLGQAFCEALGDKRGIERFGFAAPMDDALAQVALDLGGRAVLEWQVQFQREMLGEVPTEMFSHFFRSFCDSAKCNLNIRADGENDHHKIEAVFKAFAKALAMATRQSKEMGEFPSTK